MEFIKKNYEKIILSIVLLGLVGVLVLMWFVIEADQQSMREMEQTVIPSSPKPLGDLDLSLQQTVLVRLKSPYKLDFSTTNKLFNPVQWLKNKDGALIPVRTGRETGPGAAVVTAITPLYFSISLDSVMPGDSGARYIMFVENQVAAVPAQRHPMRHYLSVGEKVPGVFTLLQVKGPPENPTQLVVKLADTGETNTLSSDQPFRRVDGYSADLHYEPDKLNFKAQRVGDHISFGGDDYNIVAIDQNEVILSAQSNQRNYTLRYAP